MKAHVLFASSALALGLIVGCDDQRTGSTEPQATPAGGRVSGSNANDSQNTTPPARQSDGMGGQSGDNATGSGTSTGGRTPPAAPGGANDGAGGM